MREGREHKRIECVWASSSIVDMNVVRNSACCSKSIYIISSDEALSRPLRRGISIAQMISTILSCGGRGFGGVCRTVMTFGRGATFLAGLPSKSNPY